MYILEKTITDELGIPKIEKGGLVFETMGDAKNYLLKYFAQDSNDVKDIEKGFCRYNDDIVYRIIPK